MGTNFKDLLTNTDSEEMINEIRKIADEKLTESIPILLNILEDTNDNWIRNEAAIALSDLKVQEAVEPIIKMIKSTRTDGNKGTLVYALSELNYSEHLDFIFSLLINGNFEVSRNAYRLIEKSLSENNNDLALIKKQIGLLVDKINDLQDDIDFFSSSLLLLSK